MKVILKSYIFFIFLILLCSCTGRSRIGTREPSGTPVAGIPGSPEPTESDTQETFSPSVRVPETPGISSTPEAPIISPGRGKALLEKGKKHLEQAQYEQAIKSFNEALEQNQDLSEAYAYRGRAYLDMQKYDKAKEDLEKSLSLNPNSGEAHFFLGILKQQTFDNGAVYDFDRAISLDPKNAEAYYRRGIIYLEKGEREKATKDLEKAEDLDPSGEVGNLAREKLDEVKKEVKLDKFR